MMQTHLDDPVYIQTGNPTTRTVNPGKQMREREKMSNQLLFSRTKQTHKCPSFSTLSRPAVHDGGVVFSIFFLAEFDKRLFC